jgi:lipid A 3-O-deacylase
MRKQTAVIWAALGALLLLRSSAWTEDRKSVGTFGLFIENDLFAGSDGGYTNGEKLVWVSPELGDGPGKGRVPRWLDTMSRKLTPVRSPERGRFLSLGLGLSIFTPEDILRKDLILNDRPYAGYLYASLGFHRAAASSMESIEIDIGIVGPRSLAGDIQKSLHRIFHWTYPEGWANQLKDELALGIAYDRKWKVRPAGKTGQRHWDLIAHGGGMASNVFTGASGGLEFRLGRRLPDDFGTSLIGPGSDSASLFEGMEPLAGNRRLSIHAFAALEGRAVARDIFLDGNTFRRSHKVEKLRSRNCR